MQASARAAAAAAGPRTARANRFPPPLLPGERRISEAGLARQDAGRRRARRPTQKFHSYHHGSLFIAALRRARELLETYGPEAITMRRLARDLGVTAPALHYHFRRKGELLACLAESLADELEPQLRTAATANSPAEGLAAATAAFVRFARERPAAYRLVSREGWFHACGWGTSLGIPLAHFGGQALAGAGPALEAHRATFPPPPPKRLDHNGCLHRDWHLEMCLFPRGMTLPTTPAQTDHGWLFSVALLGLAQAELTGSIPRPVVDRLVGRMPELVLQAATAAGARGPG